MPKANGQITIVDLNDAILSGTAPLNPVLGTLWIDTSATPNKLNSWNGSAWIPQSLDISALDPEFHEEMQEIKTFVLNASGDGYISASEKLNTKLLLVEITGDTLSGDTLPTMTTIDSRPGGQVYLTRAEARAAGVPTSHASYLAFQTGYNDLRVYLNGLTPRPWQPGDTKVTPATWTAKWTAYYEGLSKLRVTTSEYLANSLKPGASYNGVTMESTNGIVVLRGDNIVRTKMNATDGIAIEKNNSGTWTPVFGVNTAGTLFAKGLDISSDSKLNGSTVSTVVSNASTAYTNSNTLKNTTVPALTTRVTEAETSLSVLPGQIQSKVSQTEFDSLAIGTRNLLFNGNFAADKKHWTNPNANFTVISDSTFGKVARLQATTSRGGLLQERTYTDKAIVDGEEYVWSLWMKADVAQTIDVGIDGGGASNAAGFAVTTEWKKFSSSRISSDSNNIFRIYSRASTGSGYFYVANIKIEKGNKASDYTPAPEDVEEKINLLDTRLGTAETSITQTSGAIELKANSKDVYTITQANEEIGKKADQTALNATNQNVTAALDEAKKALRASVHVISNSPEIGNAFHNGYGHALKVDEDIHMGRCEVNSSAAGSLTVHLRKRSNGEVLESKTYTLNQGMNTISLDMFLSKDVGEYSLMADTSLSLHRQTSGAPFTSGTFTILGGVSGSGTGTPNSGHYYFYNIEIAGMGVDGSVVDSKLKADVIAAKATADSGVSKATAAQSTADSGVSKANAAQGTADTGLSKANAAQGTANEAKGTADTLKNTTVPAIVTRVTNAESAITQTSNDIALRVTKTEYEEGIEKTKKYVQSRGENLVTNGTGLLGDNTNFKSFTFDGAQVFAGGGSFYTDGQNTTRTSDELIPVDAEQKYRFSLMAKQALGVGHAYAGVVSYDIDGKSIGTQDYYGSQFTPVELTQDLKAGDTVIHVSDVSQFRDDRTPADHYHSFVLWGYKNSFGYEYPAGTYSRYNMSTAWEPGTIDRANKRIILNKPFNIVNPHDPSGAFKAGHKISPTHSGGSYQYMSMGNAKIPTEWTKYEGEITGNGISSNKFPYGTGFVKLLFLLNRSSSGGQAGDSTWVNSLEFYNIAQEERAKTYADTSTSNAKSEIKITTDGISQNVGALTTKVNDNITNISKHETSINTLKDEILLKATKEEVISRTLDVRYIKVTAVGSTANTTNHIVELEAFNAAGTNVARGKTTIISSTSLGSTASRITDGNTSTDSYHGFSSGKQWIQLDLGSVYEDLEYLNVWMYYSDGRTYKDTLIEVSENGVTWTALHRGNLKTDSEKGFIVKVNDNLTVNRINSAQAQISVQAGQISSKVESTDFTGQKVISMVNQTADDFKILAKNIELQGAVTFASLDSSTQTKVTAGSTAKTTLDSKASVWDAKETPAGAQAKVEALEVGSRNLLMNSNFYKKSLEGWSNNGSVSYISIDGKNAANIKTSSGIYQYPVNETAYYSFSFLAKAATSNATQARIGFLNVGSQNKYFDITTSWTRYTFSTTAAIAAGQIFHVYSAGQPYYITDVAVVRGNKAPDWSPAPEDVDAAVGAVKSTADTVSTTVMNNTSVWGRASNINSDGTVNTSKLKGTVSDSQVASASSWNAAKSTVDDMSNDNKLTPSEKRTLKIEYDAIVKEKEELGPLASAFGVSTTLYYTAYNNLKDYLDPFLGNLTNTSTIVGSTMRGYFESYYGEAGKISARISEKTKELADNAQRTVDEMEIGGTNLLRNSNFALGNRDWYELPTIKQEGSLKYVSQTYEWEVRMDDFLANEGEEFTFSVLARGTGNMRASIRPLDASGSQIASNSLTAPLTSEWRRIVLGTYKAPAGTKSLRLYFLNTTDPHIADFTNLKIEKGNKATGWSPAVEDITAEIATAVKPSNDQLAAWAHANNETLIDGGKIFTSSIRADQIAADTITATNGLVKSLDASKITAGKVKAQYIQIGDETEFAEGMDPRKLDYDGKNLLDLSTLNTGYLNENGTVTDSSGWRITGFIKVSPGEQYLASGYQNLGTSPSTCFYDASYTFVSGIKNNNSGGIPENDQRRVVTVPDGCTYLKFSFESSDLSTIKLSKGSVALLWQHKMSTYIDGGSIYANSITANQMATNSITIGSLTEDVKTKVENGDDAKQTLNSKASDWDAKATTTQVSTALDSAKKHADISTFGDFKVFRNPIGYSSGSSTATGYCIIETPIQASYMTKIRIKGYNYSETKTSIDLIVDFYAHGSGFTRTGFTSMGDFVVDKVQLGRNPSGKAIIVINSSNTVWNYPKLYVESAEMGYNTPPDSYLSGWKIEFTSAMPSLSYLSNVVGRNIDGTFRSVEDWRVTGKTTIDGGRIETDSIRAAQINAGEIETEHITSVGLNASVIKAGVIDAEHIRIGSNSSYDDGYNPVLKTNRVDIPFLTDGESSDWIILLCAVGEGTSNHVNGRLYGRRVSGHSNSAVIDIVVNHNSSGSPSGAFRSVGVQSADQYELVRCTYGGTEYIGLRYAGGSAYQIWSTSAAFDGDYRSSGSDAMKAVDTSACTGVGTFTNHHDAADQTSAPIKWPGGSTDDANRAVVRVGDWEYGSDSTYINGGKIFTGTITADQIGANAITTEELAAGSVTASKLEVSSQNMLWNIDTFAQYKEGVAPNGSEGNSSNSIVSEVDSPIGKNCLKHVSTGTNSYKYLHSDSNTSAGWVRLSSGKKYILSAYVKTTSTSSTPVQIITIPREYGSGTTAGTSSSVYKTISASDGWIRISTAITTISGTNPALAFYVRNSSSGITTYWTGFMLEEYKGSDENPSPFVPGGSVRIEGGNLTANSITATQIATGSITATNGIIASLDAGKITTGTMDAKYITAGTIKSDHINTTGLDAKHIKFGTMNGDRIDVGTIKSDHVNTTGLDAKHIKFGVMHGDRIDTNTLHANRIQSGTITTDKLTTGSNPNLITEGYDNLQQIPLGTSGITVDTLDGASSHEISESITGLTGSKVLFQVNGGVLLAPHKTSYNIRVDAGKTYFVSAYVNRTISDSALAYRIGLKFNTSDTPVFTSGSISSHNTFTRISGKVTAPSGATGAILYIYLSASWYSDAYQVEECVPGQSEASAWKPAGTTVIHGGNIVTNSIESKHISTTGLDAKHINTGTMQGASINLGGVNNTNGTLEVFSTTGEPIAELNGDFGGFPRLYVDYLDAPNKVEYGNYTDQTLKLYVNGSATTYGTPSDENSGTGLGESLATLGEALRRVPNQFDGEATIFVHHGEVLYEDVNISGFSGGGILKIQNSSSSTRPTINGSLNIVNNSVRLEWRDININSTNDYAGVFVQNTCGLMADAAINGTNGTSNVTSNAVNVNAGGFFEFYRVNASNVRVGFRASYGGFAFVSSCTGRGDLYGLQAYGGGIIAGSGTAPQGSSSNTATTAGGQISGSWSYPTPPAAPSYTKETVVTKWTSNSDSGSYRSDYGSWDTYSSANQVTQGSYSGHGRFYGSWFFGSSVYSAVNGKNIKRIRVYIKRDAGGSSASQKVTITTHSNSSRPGGNSSFSSTSYDAGFKVGEGKWVTLPSSFHTAFRTGGARGFGINGSSPYMKFSKNATIEVTYEK